MLQEHVYCLQLRIGINFNFLPTASYKYVVPTWFISFFGQKRRKKNDYHKKNFGEKKILKLFKNA